MRASVAAMAAAVGLLGAAQAHGQACGGLAGAQTIESAAYVVAFRTDPAKIEIGRHFSLDVAVCPKGAAAAPGQIRIDGYMPEHRHGMNYQAAVKPAGEGRWRADGLMFHMPGRWDLIFDVRGSSGSERLTHGIDLQ